jgi:hypothetical protein
MRKADVEVREVVCSETGKPIPKIPLWMAKVKVKFVSEEAKSRHASPHGMSDAAIRSQDADEVEEEKIDVDDTPDDTDDEYSDDDEDN